MPSTRANQPWPKSSSPRSSRKSFTCPFDPFSFYLDREIVSFLSNKQTNRKEILAHLDKSLFLSTCTRWLTPLKAGQLPNLEIRAFILKALSQFDIDDDQVSDLLKESKVGSALRYLSEHPKETGEHKKMAGKLICEHSPFNLMWPAF